MKFLIAFAAGFAGIAGVLAFAVVDEAEPHRAQVRSFLDDRLDGGPGGLADDTAAAIRNLVGEDTPDEAPAVADVAGEDPAADEGEAEATTDSDVHEAVAGVYEIVTGSGIGVSFRSECSDDARIEGGLAEREAIAIVEVGTDACAGWTLIESTVSGVQSWVRDQYVATRPSDGAAPPPLVAAPSAPTAVATPTPTPTAAPSATATVAPTATAEASAVWFGRLRGEPGDAVSASIDGVDCASTTAYEKDGGAFYYIAIAADAACGPSDGAHVEFRVNGTMAAATGVWHAGGSVQLSLGD